MSNETDNMNEAVNEKWTRIKTRTEYLRKCADVHFGDEGGESVATSAGEISGNFGGQELKGSWHWEGEYFCRTSTLGDLDIGSDCLVIEVTPTKMRLTLQKGEGPSVVYDRKGAPLADDDITILSTFDIKAGNVEQFIPPMVDNMRHVRQESGNLEMRIFQDVNNPSIFFVFGRTAGQTGLEAHEEEVADRGIADIVSGMMNAAPVTRNLGETIPSAIYPPNERQANDDELLVFALFDFKPGYRDKVLAQYEKQVPLVRADDANIAFNVYTIDGQDDKLVVHERWTNQAVAQAFAQTRPTSIETGALLFEAVKGEIGDYMHTVIEIDPYPAQ